MQTCPVEVKCRRGNASVPLQLPLPLQPFHRSSPSVICEHASLPSTTNYSGRSKSNIDGCAMDARCCSLSPGLVKYVQLDSQITSLASRVGLTDSDILARRQVIRTIQVALDRLDASVVAEPFGSFAAGLSLPTSDVDIALIAASDAVGRAHRTNWWELPPSDVAEHADDHVPVAPPLQRLPCSECFSAVHHLSIDEVSAALRDSASIFNIFCIKAGAMPKIMLSVSHDVSSVGPISVEITAASFQPNPCAAASRHPGISVRDFVQAVLRDYPSIRPVFMVLRALLRSRNLADPHLGGLGPYPLFIIIYYWARFRGQSSETVKFGRAGEEGELGRMLMEFLKWSASMVPWHRCALDWAPVDASHDVACHFDPIFTARCCAPGHALDASAASAAVVADPLNPRVNVAAVSSSLLLAALMFDV
jgi:hypothetical protein